MGGSKHPKNVKRALDAVAAVKKTITKDSTHFTKTAKACSDAAAIAKAMPRDYDSVYRTLQQITEKYAEKAFLIQEAEEELASASGDRKKEAELKKKIKKLDAEAETISASYGEARKTFASLRALLGDQLSAATTEFGKINSSL